MFRGKGVLVTKVKRGRAHCSWMSEGEGFPGWVVGCLPCLTDPSSPGKPFSGSGNSAFMIKF